MFHRADPGSVLPPLVRGFDAACPLLDAELDALPDLILARVAASLAISARQGAIHPDPYLRISEAPGWALLGWLDATGAGALRATVHAAVGR
jgi:Ser/Thr protein kinase RdoA (MazF antagonist)